MTKDEKLEEKIDALQVEQDLRRGLEQEFKSISEKIKQMDEQINVLSNERQKLVNKLLEIQGSVKTLNELRAKIMAPIAKNN